MVTKTGFTEHQKIVWEFLGWFYDSFCELFSAPSVIRLRQEEFDTFRLYSSILRWVPALRLLKAAYLGVRLLKVEASFVKK